MDELREESSSTHPKDDSWVTMSTSDSDSSNQDSKQTSDGSLDDTLPIELLAEDKDTMTDGHVKAEGLSMLPNSNFHLCNTKIIRCSSCRKDNVVSFNIKLPEYSSDFHPVCCSSRLISFGKVPCDTLEFHPVFCSTRCCKDEQEVKDFCLSSKMELQPLNPVRRQSSIFSEFNPRFSSTHMELQSMSKQQQSSIASEFNPPFSSTKQALCNCYCPRYCLHHFRGNQKSDLSEFSPLISSTKIKLERRFKSNLSFLKMPYYRAGRKAADNISTCKAFTLKRFSTDLPIRSDKTFVKSSLSNFSSEFYSTARSALFLPLKCSTAQNESQVFNPIISSSVVVDSSNIPEMVELRLESKDGVH